MLRRRFNWQYLDILYKKRNQMKVKRKSLAEEFKPRLLSVDLNLGDLLLYEAMNSSWYRQPEAQQEDFWDEVSLN